MKRSILWMAVMAGLAMPACGDPDTVDGEDPAEANNGKADSFDDDTMLCAAIRGNGDKIPAHFGGLARIVEHYGLIEGASGGSSGSITTFMLSSIQANPQLAECGGAACSDEQTRLRAALLLKSFHGYIEVLATSDEVLAARAIAPLAQKIQEQGIDALLEQDSAAGVEALQTLLESDDVRALINPEVLALLQQSPDPTFHARDISAAITGFGSFSADDPKILVRPGVLSFPGLADRLGVAASFYAGYNEFYDAAGMESFMAACAEPARGMTWAQAKNLPAGDSTCGQAFGTLLVSYREAFDAATSPSSRADDAVGTLMPALVSTSVLTGGAVDAWNSARTQYLEGKEPVLTSNFADVRFGYFGDSDTLAVTQAAVAERTDAKSRRFESLGQRPWREVLSYSPAEPGLARALELGDGRVSAGGWSDLHPTLVLRSMGCDEIVYVTREGEESRFAQGVATLLGMTEADRAELYDLVEPDSAYSQSLAEADAILCTQWDALETSDFVGVIENAYNSPLVTTDDYFLESDAPYSNTAPDSDRAGCSPPR